MNGLLKSFPTLAYRAESRAMPNKGHAAVAQGVEVAKGFLDSLAIVHANVGDTFLRRPYIIKGRRDAAISNSLDKVLVHFGQRPPDLQREGQS